MSGPKPNTSTSQSSISPNEYTPTSTSSRSARAAASNGRPGSRASVSDSQVHGAVVASLNPLTDVTRLGTRNAAATAAEIWTRIAMVLAGRRIEARAASRPNRPPVGTRAARRCVTLRPYGDPSRSRNASASGRRVTRAAARAATSRAPTSAPIALAATTHQSIAKSGVTPTNSWSTIRAMRLLISTPSGRPTASATAVIAIAMRRRRRRSGRARPPRARITATSRVRSVISVFVVDASRTSATSPATMPNRPMRVLTCSMSASIGVEPLGSEVGNSVNASPPSASTSHVASVIARSSSAPSSTAVITNRFVPPVRATTESRSA